MDLGVHNDGWKMYTGREWKMKKMQHSGLEKPEINPSRLGSVNGCGGPKSEDNKTAGRRTRSLAEP